MTNERRQAVTLAAMRELENAKRWFAYAKNINPGELAYDNKGIRRFNLDANAAIMKATRLLNHLRDNRPLPADLEDAVKCCMPRP